MLIRCGLLRANALLIRSHLPDGHHSGFGDIDARDYSGRTALMRAADGNHGECIETLVKRSVLALPNGVTQLRFHYFMSNAAEIPLDSHST